MKLKQNSKVRVVGLSSFMALLALLGSAIFCPSPEGADAIERTTRLGIDFVLRQALDSKKLSVDFYLASGGGIDYESVAKQLGIDFVIAPKLSITLDPTTASTVTGSWVSSSQPTAGGTVVTGSRDFTVNTNSTAGLAVCVYSNSANLTGGSTPIQSVSSASTTSAMATDRWGYNLDLQSATTSSLTYSAMPTTQGTSAGATGCKGYDKGEKALRLSFAAKVGLGTAAGTYSNTVNLKATPSAESTAAANYLMRKIDEAADQAAQEAGYADFADYQAQKAAEEANAESIEGGEGGEVSQTE